MLWLVHLSMSVVDKTLIDRAVAKVEEGDVLAKIVRLSRIHWDGVRAMLPVSLVRPLVY